MRDLIKIAESLVAIEGLPANVEINDPELLKIINSPRYTITAKRDGEDYELLINPARTDRMKSHDQARGRGRIFRIHYDPRRAKLVPYDDDPTIALGRMKAAHNGYKAEIEPLSGNVMYRGMSYEEWKFIEETGEVKSRGEGNLGSDQNDLTYWSTDIQSARNYAHSFAAMANKAAPEFPAYIVAAPLAEKVKHVDGVARHEVGVMGAILRKDLLAVWEGKVWSFTSSDTLLRQHWDGSWRSSGLSHPSAQLEWKRIF